MGFKTNNNDAVAVADSTSVKAADYGKVTLEDFFEAARTKRIKEIQVGWDKRYRGWEYDKMWFREMTKLARNGYLPFSKFLVLPHLENLRVDLDWAKAAESCHEHSRPIQPWHKFEKDRLANRRFPVFTYSTILLCVLIHIVRAGMREWDFSNLGSPSPSDPLLRALAVTPHGTEQRGEYHRMLTYMFLHADFGHLLNNMLTMFCLGSTLERIHGSGTIGFMFLLSVAGAALTLYLVDGVAAGFAASGGTHGLSGVLYADMWTNWDLIKADLKNLPLRLSPIPYSWFSELLWHCNIYLLLEIFGTGKIAHSAHLGGLFFGFCFSLPILKYSRDSGIIKGSSILTGPKRVNN